MINYLNQGSRFEIDINGEKSYSSINQEFRKQENKIVPTGIYIVYLLHPQKGSVNLRIEWHKAAKKYSIAKREGDEQIEEAVMRQILNNIGLLKQYCNRPYQVFHKLGVVELGEHLDN